MPTNEQRERDRRRYAAMKSDPVKYAAHRERKRNEWRNRPPKPGSEAERKKRWRELNPDKDERLRKAHRAVELAIHQGWRRPANCQLCGNSGPIEAHHHQGYDRAHWLDVMWLCPPCHRLADQEVGRAGSERTKP